MAKRKTPFAIRILNGRLFMNGEGIDHLVDFDDRVYTTVTSYRISDELQDMIQRAFNAGRMVEREDGQRTRTRTRKDAHRAQG